MDELIEKVQNTLEERNICIPEDYDIKNILVDYDSIDVTDDIFEEIIAKYKNITSPIVWVQALLLKNPCSP